MCVHPSKSLTEKGESLITKKYLRHVRVLSPYSQPPVSYPPSPQYLLYVCLPGPAKSTSNTAWPAAALFL